MISVLCVDDDSEYLSLEKRSLEEPGVLTVTTALSAPEALKEMETNRFDAVVAGYQMPGMDGIGLLRAVRAAHPGLPFILFTGKGREEVVIEAFNSGADFYLQKNGEPKIRFAQLKDTIIRAVKLGAVWEGFHDSETRYRRLFETAQDGILILDAESGKITDANPFFLTLLGYTRDELLGKKLREIGFIRDKALAEQAYADLKKTGYIRYEDLPLATKDGRVIEAEFVGNAYIVDTKKVIQCNIRDIAGRRRADEAARVSLAKYQVLFESVPLGVTISDKAGNIVESNRMAEHLLGLPKKDQMGRQIDGREWQIIRPDGSPMPADEYASVRSLKENCLVSDVEMGLVKGEGDITWINVTAAPIPLEGYGVAIAYSDITGHKRAEKALRESEERYRTVLENVPDLILVHRNGVILYINPPAAEVMGKTYDELINKQMTDFIVPEYRPLVAQAISRRMEGKNIEPYEIEILTTSGGRRTVAVRGSLIEFAGSPASLNVLTDITDNKQAEAALKKSEDLLKRTGEIARVGGWELDAETHAVTWTEETYHIHEVPVGQMPPLEETINFFHPDDRRKLSDAIRRALTTGEGYDMELRIITATGKQLWTRTVCQPQVVGGKTIRLIGTFQDITERKAAEEAMSTFSDDLERKVTERTSDISDVNLNLMTEIEIRLDAEKHLTKTVGEKELLLREVHHRVKNNLQIIISLLNLQSRYIEDETTLSAFRESQNRIKAMALVHEKLYQSTDISKIDLDNYIRFLGTSLFQFFGMKGKGITLTMDIRDIFLSIDTAIPLGLMINELISNSLKYAFPGGREGDISVTVQRQDHTLTILFKDNGAGIPQDFDWRNAKSLGLRLVISLVEQLEGTIELDRTAGTAFTIVVKEKE
jgi:PAS domain S-box-containing protein